jgi:hypothetical protein
VFARVAFNESIRDATADSARWPLVDDPVTGEKAYQHTGLLVIGYWSDAKRFDSHLADFNGLLKRLEFPASTVPPKNELPIVAAPRAPEAPPAPAASEAPEAEN